MWVGTRELGKQPPTPGEDVDILVTERGIAVNPKRVDILEKLKGTNLPVMPIEKLL